MIPLINLKAQYQKHRSQILKKIDQLCLKSDFILGESLEIFEKNLAKQFNYQNVIGCASGTDALILALMALGIKKGDEVITTSHTWASTVLAILKIGAKPVLVDIEPGFFNIDASQIQKKITSKTKAIIAVHLYGHPADMDELEKIAHQHQLFLIEDAAQAIGAKVGKKFIGELGDIGCLSFYPGKNLGAYGDGGALICANTKWAQKLKRLRNYGQKKRYHLFELGINSRLDSMQAVILNEKLKMLKKDTKKRQKKALIYQAELGDCGFILPQIKQNYQSVFHCYVIQTKKRNKLLNYLHQKGISAQIHYPIPVYRQKAFLKLNLNPKDFPQTEKITKKILSLPLCPYLSENNQATVIQTLKKFKKLFL